jgi:hypothetical protein
VYDVITLFEGRGSYPQQVETRTRTVEQVEAEKMALAMVDNMKRKFGYNDVSAREAFVHLFKKRY